MRTRSGKLSQPARDTQPLAPVERPSTPQTPVILRGEDDNSPREESSTAFRRYVSRQKNAVLMNKLYSAEYNKSSHKRQRNAMGGELRILRPVKKRCACAGNNVPRDRESVNGEASRDARRDFTAMGDESEGYPCADQEEPQEASQEDGRADRNDRDGDENRNDMNCSGDRSSQDQGNEQRGIEEEVVDEGQKSDEERSDRESNAGDRSEGERSHDERDESEGIDSERSEDNQGDSDGRDSEQSRVEVQRRNTGDGIFPGEVYRPPRTIRFNRGRCTRTNATTAHVVINYNVITATNCPCEDKECIKLVNVGTWGILGRGRTVCVHCGFKRQGGWQGSGYGFMEKEDYVRHLSSAKCRAARGMSTEKKT